MLFCLWHTFLKNRIQFSFHLLPFFCVNMGVCLPEFCDRMAKALGYQTVIDTIHYKERSVTVTEAMWRDTFDSRKSNILIQVPGKIGSR